MLPTVLRRKAVLSGHLPLRLARSRARLQGRQAGEGWGQKADRGRAQAGRSPRAPADPREARATRRASRGLTDFLVGVFKAVGLPRAASLTSLLRLLSDGMSVCPWPPAPLFLKAATRRIAWFSHRLHHLSNTEVLMVANQSPAGLAGSR